MSDVANDMKRIERSVMARVPASDRFFARPAEKVVIASTEAALGLSLPDDVRALYELADGQAEGGPSLRDAFTLMALAEVVDAAAFLSDFFPNGRNEEDPDHDPIEADAGIKPTWWSRHWVPLLTNGGGDYYCVDLAPADGGTVGQIITYFHDDAIRSHVAPSTGTLLHVVAEGLEDGSYTIVDGMIMEIPDEER